MVTRSCQPVGARPDFHNSFLVEPAGSHRSQLVLSRYELFELLAFQRHRGVSIFISGISDDSTLSAGRDTKSGYFLLDPDDLDGLKLRTPSNSSPFEIMISVMFEGKEVAKKTLEYEFKDD